MIVLRACCGDKFQPGGLPSTSSMKVIPKLQMSIAGEMAFSGARQYTFRANVVEES